MESQPIQLLGISGSPRDASTALSVKKALIYAEEKFHAQTDYFSLQNKTINFCIHCDFCLREKKGCIHEDDMKEAYKKMKKASAIIIGTPVYSGSISGQLKTFLDRCRALVTQDQDALKNKVGAGIAVGGDRSGGQELALITLHSFFLANKMIPISGGPFGSNLGGTIWSRDLGRQGSEQDLEGLKTVYRTVNRLVSIANILKEARRK